LIALSAHRTGSDVHSRASAAFQATLAGRSADHDFVGFGYEPEIEGKWSGPASLMFISAASFSLWALIILTFVRIF